MVCLPLWAHDFLQVEIMMALEEKFDLQLDEEGEYATYTFAYHACQAEASCINGVACKLYKPSR